jgi:hypothetical protein
MQALNQKQKSAKTTNHIQKVRKNFFLDVYFSEYASSS